MTASSIRIQLLDGLSRLAQSTASEVRLVFEAGPVYMVWIARRGQGQIEHEAVASSALPAQFKLSSERGKLMRELGFGKRSGRRNWRRECPRTELDLERMCDEALDIFTQIYAVAEAEQPYRVALHEDQRAHPHNPELLEAMRRVSKGWDEEIRRAMYTQMLNSTFLVPIDLSEDPDAEGSDAFMNFDTHPSGRPTLGVFTDWETLRLWAPRGHEYWPLHGSELFEMAHERRPVSLRINPDGDVGGELYGHEVEMLVRAVHSHRQRWQN